MWQIGMASVWSMVAFADKRQYTKLFNFPMLQMQLQLNAEIKKNKKNK